MTITKLGYRVAALIRVAMEKQELGAPTIARMVGCHTNAVYTWRDGQSVPKWWAIPGLARALHIDESRLEKAAQQDRADRHGPAPSALPASRKRETVRS